ncbi:MAG TPA: ribonuclease R [Gammaproteobacteria bacterium]|nr:ribonuclease R [Gammaproteobacteria bacterium]
MHRSKPPRHPADPHAAREAARYDKPIPSREFILELLREAGVPRSAEQIARALNVTDTDGLEAMERRLNAMERAGQVMRNRRGGYGLVSKMDLIKGRVTAHPDGYGFLIPEAGGEDLFLAAPQMKSLLHGDRALVRITGRDRRGRSEAALVEVLERANQNVVGRYHSPHGGVGYVVPDNRRIHQDILIPAGQDGGACNGQVVIAVLTAQPTLHHQPIGRVAEVLGEHGAPGMEIDIAVRSHGLPHVWPEAVVEEAGALPTGVRADDRRGRLDLRGLPLVTIDGEDARDFDDAVYCERQGQGFRLLVAIADVAHYVRPGNALDDEARRRGTSVYFPDHVIPMLPEALSNGLCSLNPKVDRLCLVCELHFDARGVRRSYQFHAAVMHSHARFTYTEVAAVLLAQDPALRRRHAALVPHLENLHALYRNLRQQRTRRGAIDFETTETRILFNAERKIDRIVPVARNEAHTLIEECMIAANVAAAEYLLERTMPALYRVHAPPLAEKLEDLREFLSGMGLALRRREPPAAHDYAELLATVRDRPDAELIQTVLLRSLKLAVYSPENIGHFGLALPAYAHFTSPIRRYPDLLVHRAIHHCLKGGKAAHYRYDNAAMRTLGEECSTTERRADEATRDAVAWLKCDYMRDKVGETYTGIISGVTGFGLFVTLRDIYVEGLVHITALPNDYYHCDTLHHRLRGERTGRQYRLGDALTVRVVRVDMDDRKIDFEAVDTGPAPAHADRSEPGARKPSRPHKHRKNHRASHKTSRKPHRGPRGKKR